MRPLPWASSSFLLALTGCTSGTIDGATADGAATTADAAVTASHPATTVDAPAAAADAAVDAAPPAPGLHATYYLDYRDGVVERIDATVDFSWGDQAPAAELGVDHFSARWTGELIVPATGDYTFVTTA